MTLRSYLMTRFALVCFLAVAGCSTQPPESSAEDALTLEQLPIRLSRPTVDGQFDQDVDHPRTSESTLGTFKQRYWYSTEFARGPAIEATRAEYYDPIAAGHV